MERIILSLLLVVSLISCKKTDNNTPNNGSNNNQGEIKNKNTITITDNGVTYSAIEEWAQFTYSKNQVLANQDNDTDIYGSRCGLFVKEDLYEFSLDISAKFGPVNGIGRYTNASFDVGNYFVQNYDSKKMWAADSIEVNVNSLDSGRIKGDFKLWLTRANNENKIVTGTFDCN